MTTRGRRRSRTDSKKPTVLFLDNSSTFGGAIVSLKHLVSELARQGVRPVVVSGQPAARLEDAFPNARTISVDVRVPHRHPTPLLRRMREDPPRSKLLEWTGLKLAAADWHLRRTIPTAMEYARLGKHHDPDLVHLNNIIGGQLDGLLAAKMLGVPCIAHARGFQSPDPVLWAASRVVDHHLAISTAIAENLEEAGAPRNHISLVPDGIDVERFSTSRDKVAVRRSLGIPLDAPTFGLFGRVVEWKGTREFVLAAERVLHELPTAHAVIVGDVSDGDAGYLREVRQLAEESGFAERIIFTGYRDDIPGLMQALDLVVHTSIRPEPFGMVIVEAMAAGTPVIAANRGGPRDIIRDGESGILVDPTDTGALATAIQVLLETPDRARALAEAGRDRVRRLFGKERYAERVAGVYEEVLGRRLMR